MSKLLLLLFLFVNLSLFSQKHAFFNPDDYDAGDFVTHFKGTTGKFMRYEFEHKVDGKINWRKNVYYEKGKIVKVTYTDTLDRLKRSMYTGCSYSIVKYKNDEKGKRIEASYWDEDLERTDNVCGGIHRAEFAYDDKGRLKSLKAYNEKNEFICDVHYSYLGDSEDIDEISYHTQKGELYFISTAKVKFLYDKKGNIIGRTFTSNSGELPESDIKTIKIKYKNKKVRFGNQVSTSFRVHTFYNEEGKVVDKMNVIGFKPRKKTIYDFAKIFNKPQKWISF